MSLRVLEKRFRHDNDCLMVGCPYHIMRIEYQTVSDAIKVMVDGEEIYNGDLNTSEALVELVSEVLK